MISCLGDYCQQTWGLPGSVDWAIFPFRKGMLAACRGIRDRRNNMIRTLILSLGLAVLIGLGIVFVILPVGWKPLPLVFMAVVMAVLLVRLKPAQGSNGDAPEGESPGGTAQDLPAEPDQQGEPKAVVLRRANRILGPVIAGMIIDLVDFATFGPVGLVLGFPFGGLAGYWMGRALGFGARGSMWCGIASGVYCTIPGTEFIPLATIVGACARFNEPARGRKRKRHQKTKAASRAPSLEPPA